MSDVMIRTSGLTKRFGDVKALDQVDFEVRKGEVVGFLGPNGAGKSTTMRILTCFISPTAGAATVSIVLADTGVTTIEVPHLARLIEERQFDTIYHEHYSYFSLGTVAEMVRRHGLEVFDVEELPTHGGSLRIYLHHASDDSHPSTDRVEAMLAYEDSKGLRTEAPYVAFGEAVKNLKWDLMELLIDLKRQGKEVVGYGAAGKGNTLLNYCGIRTDFLSYIADRNHHKHGLFTPGTHIPVVAPELIDQTSPDVVMILPWNLKDEIMRQLSAHQERGGQFLIPIPDPVLIGGTR